MHKKLTDPASEEWLWLPKGRGEPRRWYPVLPLGQRQGIECTGSWELVGPKPRVRGCGKVAFPVADILRWPARCAAIMCANGCIPSFLQPQWRKPKKGRVGQFIPLQKQRQIDASGNVGRDDEETVWTSHPIREPWLAQAGHGLLQLEALEHPDPGFLVFRVANKGPLCFLGQPCCQFVSHLLKKPNY